jgi:hypothetical protein
VVAPRTLSSTDMIEPAASYWKVRRTKDLSGNK